MWDPPRLTSVSDRATRDILQSLKGKLGDLDAQLAFVGGGGGAGTLPVGGTAGQWLKKNSSSVYDAVWAGITAGDVSGLGALATKSTIASADITDGTIVNADINAAAAIARSKLDFGSGLVNADIAAGAAIVRSKLDFGSGLTNSDISATAAIVRTKLDFGTGLVNADISATAGITYGKLNLSASIVNADIATGAAIAYSKLNLAGAVTNADLAGGIGYGKLVLTGSVTNADLAGSIALTKLATQAAHTFLANATASAAAPTAITPATAKSELAITYADIAFGGNIVNADISASAAIALTKLATIGAHTYLGNNAASAAAPTALTRAQLVSDLALAYADISLGGNIVNADIKSTAAIARSKLDFGTGLVNADIATGAAIAYSKLSLTGSIVGGDISSSAALSVATVTASGAITGSGFVGTTLQESTFAGSYVWLVGGQVAVLNRTTVGNVPFGVVGMAGQTGNLTEWKNSANVVQASVGPTGKIAAANIKNPVVAHNNATQNSTTGTALILTANTIDLAGDVTYGFGSWGPTVAGWWQITGLVEFQANVTGYREVNFFFNSTTSTVVGKMNAVNNASHVTQVPFSFPMQFNGTTDSLVIRVVQNSGVTLTVQLKAVTWDFKG